MEVTNPTNIAVQAVRERGGCGMSSPDGASVCLKEVGHGPHGFDPDLAPELHIWKTVAAKLAYLVIKFDNPNGAQDDLEAAAADYLYRLVLFERDADARAD